MGIIFTDDDNTELLDAFETDCWYYQSRISPDLQHGATRLGTASIYGLLYKAPVEVVMIRQSISYKLINALGGKIFEGGARFTLFPTKNGTLIPMYESVYRGDIIVPRGKPIRDFDVLTKGRRDKIFSFDVTRILSVISINDSNVETQYQYGRDYILKVDGVAVSVAVGLSYVDILRTAAMPVVSNVVIEWLAGAVAVPLDAQKYSVEYMASPNYVIWEDLARPRATADNDLPKTLMCVRRAFFNKDVNPLDAVDVNEDVFGQVHTAIDQQFEL